MSNKIATLAMAALVAGTAAIPVAEAGRRDNHYRGNHHAYGDHHRGRGHYKNGKWIALGIAAATAAAIAESNSRDCYYRQGRRYCRD